MMDIEHVARACHEANRVLQAAAGEKPSPHWEDAPSWQRESARAGVARAREGPRRLTPRQQHQAWTSARIAAGWRYGPVKDEAARLHPCLTGWDELPQAQRLKDTLFTAIVAALTPAPAA